MHKSSLDNMRYFRGKYLAPFEGRPLRILDVGSMDINGSYRELFSDPSWFYQGADTGPGKNVDLVLTDPYSWRGIPSGSMDVVISGQVFEHAEYFWITILEMERVLKAGGWICLIAPSGGPAHRYPVDCWRFLPDGFTALARFAGLDIVEVYLTSEKVGKYEDSSRMWNDSVLIGRKKKVHLLGRWRRELLRALLHRLIRVPPADRLPG